jgi:hypothetical protein
MTNMCLQVTSHGVATAVRAERREVRAELGPVEAFFRGVS